MKETITKKFVIILTALFSLVCITFGVLALNIKTVDASSIDSEIWLSNFVGVEEGKAYVGAVTRVNNDNYKDMYENQNVHDGEVGENDGPTAKHVQTYVLIARSESMNDYYSASLTQRHVESGNFNSNYDLYQYIEAEEFPPALVTSDVIAFSNTSEYSITNDVLDKAVAGKFIKETAKIGALAGKFYTPKHVDYYYWSYVVKVSYVAGERDSLLDLVSPSLGTLLDVINGRYVVAIEIEEIAKSAPITYSNGAQGPLVSNPANLYKNYLEDSNTNYDANQEMVRGFQKELGYYHDENSNVTIEYKAFENGLYVTKTENYSLPSLYLTSKKYAFKEISKLNGKNLADYNVIKGGDLRIEKEDGNQYTATSGDRILLQVEDYEYTYDKYNNGYIKIKYKDFQYKDLYLHVYHNDFENKPLYTVDIYPIDVKYSDNGKITLTYSKETISKILLDTVEWIVDFESNMVEINNMPSFVTKTNLTKTVDGEEIDDGFSLSFPASRESELYRMALSWCAKITEDVEFAFNYTYVEITPELEVVKVSSQTETKMYSELIGYHADEFFEDVNSIVAGENLKLKDGTEYAKFNGIDKMFNFENKTCVFDCEYLYMPLIKVSNSANEEYSLYLMEGNSLTRTAGDFNFIIPVGYRIIGFEDVNDSFIIGEFNKQFPLKTQFIFDKQMWSKTFSMHEIKAIVTDVWPVSVNYLKQIKSQITGKGSCFAELMTFNGEVKVSDYDMYKLTEEDVAKIIFEGTGDKVEFIDFINIPIKMSGVEVALKNTSEGDCYFISTGYSSTYIKGINSDGSYTYYNVPLTKFSDWQEIFGSEQCNITALAPDVFKYSDAVDPDKLYGFFQVMTFKEQFSDFNSWFKEYTASDGCVTFYQNKEVRGSELYKFLAETPSAGVLVGGSLGLLMGHPIAGATAGTTVQIATITLAEMLNDENGTYYSYFFYLDGTNNRNYASHNGAVDYDDNDSAIKNKFENEILDFVVTILLIVGAVAVITLLANLINKIQSKVLKTIMYIILAIGVGVAVYFSYPIVLEVVSAVF